MSAGRFRKLNLKLLSGLVMTTLLLSARTAAAQQDVGLFLGGAATAFVAHEGGHLFFDAVFGAGADLKKVNAGPFPFFAITHHPVSPTQEFVISSAGFWVQHTTDELILTRRPLLRDEHAPLLKGMLAFNVLTSMGYAGVAFLGRGPDERDTRGMAVSARMAEPWIGTTILAPAVIDLVRYYRPDTPWLKWASRATKIGGALLVIRAAQAN
jgi:hypothetical protein